MRVCYISYEIGRATRRISHGHFNKLRNELIDIIQWTDDSQNTLVWRFPRYENEIKNGAKLIVRESQVAVFVLQGQLADVFQPGTYTLRDAESADSVHTCRAGSMGLKARSRRRFISFPRGRSRIGNGGRRIRS